MEVEYLGLGDYFVIASCVLGIEAELLSRASDLVASDAALNAPGASFGGVEFYPDFATKIGILGYHLVRNHPLPDGNKRAALLAMIEFAERNGWSWRDLDVDETVTTLIDTAAGALTQAEFVDWVARQVFEG